MNTFPGFEAVYGNCVVIHLWEERKDYFPFAMKAGPGGNQEQGFGSTLEISKERALAKAHRLWEFSNGSANIAPPDRNSIEWTPLEIKVDPSR